MGMDLLGERADRAGPFPLVLRRISESHGDGHGARPARAWRSSPAVRSASCGGSCAGSGRLGQRRGRRRPRGRGLLRPRSWHGSCARESRCSRCAFSARAPSRPATRRSSSLFASLFTAVFFLAQFLQTASATGRSRPGCGSCRGRHAVLVAPSPARWSTAIGERPFLVAGLLLQAVGMALDRADRRRRLRTASGRAADHRRRRLSMAIPAAAERGHGRGRAAETRQGVGHVQHDARARRSVRDRHRRRGVRRRRQLCLGRRFSDGFAPAIGVSAALSLVGALAALALPRRPRATGSPRRPQPVPALETSGTR